jgi:hypothetical protein
MNNEIDNSITNAAPSSGNCNNIIDELSTSILRKEIERRYNTDKNKKIKEKK